MSAADAVEMFMALMASGLGVGFMWSIVGRE